MVKKNSKPIRQKNKCLTEDLNTTHILIYMYFQHTNKIPTNVIDKSIGSLLPRRYGDVLFPFYLIVNWFASSHIFLSKYFKYRCLGVYQASWTVLYRVFVIVNTNLILRFVGYIVELISIQLRSRRICLWKSEFLCVESIFIMDCFYV